MYKSSLQIGIFLSLVLSFCMSSANADTFVSDKSYTIQLGTFSSRELAKKHYTYLKKKLARVDKTGLRISHSSDYYVVRIGKHLEYPVARKILNKVLPIVNDACIIEESMVVAEKDTIEGKAVVAANTKSGPVTTQSEKAKMPPVNSGFLVKEREGRSPETQEYPAHVVPSREGDRSDNTAVTDVNLDEVNSQMASFLQKKNYKKAVKFIEKEISKSPRNPALYSWYGSSLLISNRPYQALKQFRKAAELAPNKPEYQNGIGYSYVYINMNSARQSITTFSKVLSLDPNNVDALEGLGAIYASVGEKQQAYKVYSKLAEKDKNAAKRLYKLISYGVELGEND